MINSSYFNYIIPYVLKDMYYDGADGFVGKYHK